MPSFAIIGWRAIAVALLALAPVGGLTVQAQPSGVVAQASDDEEEAVPARRRGVVTEEPEPTETPEESSEEKPLPLQGVSRRLDPFDANDAPTRSAQAPHSAAAAAHPGHDVVVCEAGCDGPPGTVVYKTKRE
jgi:hypothetical protein